MKRPQWDFAAQGVSSARVRFAGRGIVSRGQSFRPVLVGLEARVVLTGLLVQGSAPGSPPEITIYDSSTGAETAHFLAYDPSFQGGVRVAVGDVDGDGSLDIVTAPGPGIPGLVKVFSATGTHPQLGQFQARPNSYRGGVNVAVGDVNRDGAADIVVGADRGPGRVDVFEGVQGRLVTSFRASSRGGSGVQVAVGDLNRDNHADIVTAPVSGRPWIQVVDGASRRILARYQAFTNTPRGGVSVAVGDIDDDRTLDVVAAGATPRGAAIRVFTGTSSTPLTSYSLTNPAFRRGVRVAAVDIGAQRGGDGLALSPTASKGAAVTVFDTQAIRTRLLGAQPASTDPTVAYHLADGSGGSFLAGGNSVALATPAVVADSVLSDSTLLPYQRLGRFEIDPATNLPRFVPVVPNDPSLVGKHVVVLVHGWAADYSYWVQDVANQSPSKTLTWWDTDPSQPGYSLAANLQANNQSDSTLGPNSYWLLHGYDVNAIDTADIGLAQNIASRAAQTDPKTVVLAFTWLDDSATSSVTNPYLSEAKTALNGERLADALRTVLGSQSAFGGEIQLVGHSHGSKVATVAAVSLTTKDVPNTFNVRQLTILDSPEDQSEVSNELWADNFNWYYIQDLNTNRQDPGGVFVDNYISYLDEPYGNITTPSGNTLNQVVDVQLDSSDISLIDRHSYSAFWYDGSGESALTHGQKVGQLWSPILPGNQGPQQPPANLGASYSQPWASSSFDPSQQFVLSPTTLPARIYKSYVLAFSNPVNTTSVMVTNNASTGASVTLTQSSKVPKPVYNGSFTTEAGRLNGISFNYQFLNVAQGATLTVTLDGDPVFVMDASVVANRLGRGTITLNQSFLSFGGTHALNVILTPAGGGSSPQAQVAISNLDFFYATS